jgi:hypothetical protein
MGVTTALRWGKLQSRCAPAAPLPGRDPLQYMGFLGVLDDREWLARPRCAQADALRVESTAGRWEPCATTASGAGRPRSATSTAIVANRARQSNKGRDQVPGWLSGIRWCGNHLLWSKLPRRLRRLVARIPRRTAAPRDPFGPVPQLGRTTVAQPVAVRLWPGIRPDTVSDDMKVVFDVPEPRALGAVRVAHALTRSSSAARLPCAAGPVLVRSGPSA